MNEDQVKESLHKALRLLRDADNYLTDGDEIDEIEEEGSPDVARWAEQVRELLELHEDLLPRPE
jgi:hypothetical protein